MKKKRDWVKEFNKEFVTTDDMGYPILDPTVPKDMIIRFIADLLAEDMDKRSREYFNIK